MCRTRESLKIRSMRTTRMMGELQPRIKSERERGSVCVCVRECMRGTTRGGKGARGSSTELTGVEGDDGKEVDNVEGIEDEGLEAWGAQEAQDELNGEQDVDDEAQDLEQWQRLGIGVCSSGLWQRRECGWVCGEREQMQRGTCVAEWSCNRRTTVY